MTLDPVDVLGACSGLACCASMPVVVLAPIFLTRWLRAEPWRDRPRPPPSTLDDWTEDE